MSFHRNGFWAAAASVVLAAILVGCSTDDRPLLAPDDTADRVGVAIEGDPPATDSGSDDCPITGYVNRDLELHGDCTISGSVNGNIKIWDGTLTITGYVNGNVEQYGDGGVVITKDEMREKGGKIDGNIVEYGPGDVMVKYGWVNGKVEEYDEGSVDITLGRRQRYDGDVIEKGYGNLKIEVGPKSLFNGNAEEYDEGDLSTSGEGRFNGNTKEDGPGDCYNPIMHFDGNPCEY